METKNIFEGKICNIYKSIAPTSQSSYIPLLQALTNEKYTNKNAVEAIRNTQYKSKDYDEAKKGLYVITPSASFQPNTRSNSTVLKPTGFLQFDIDIKENPVLCENPESVKKLLMSIPYVAFIARSVSSVCGVGSGFWGLVHIPDTLDLMFHHHSFAYILNKYCEEWKIPALKLDESTARIQQPRFNFYDPEYYLNINAKVLDWGIPKIDVRINNSTTPAQVTLPNNSVGPLSRFNQSAQTEDVLNILFGFGFKNPKTHGDKIRLTRPDKDSGVSVDYDINRRTLYSFSSNTPFYEKSKRGAFSPADVVIYFGCGGNMNQAVQMIKQMGY